MSQWIRCTHPHPAARLRLFCLPYAGGNTALFQPWAKVLPEEIEVCAIQLPGRGDRLKEPPLTDLMQLIEILLPALLSELDRPYALFGHSMGALIAFELARQLRLQNTSPFSLQHLFISGRRAPDISDRHPHLHTLPDAEFLAELRQLNGTPPQVLENAELMQFFMPILRADFSLCGTYRYGEGEPLDCPLTVLGGEGDRTESAELLEGWQRQTRGEFALHLLPGDHFFIQSQQAQVLEILASALGYSA